MENTLETLIREEIAQRGPMSFACFMALALYHPTFGYYSGGGEGREPVGWSGDFFTSGDVHPLWGWCVARQLHEMWKLLDQPKRFHVIEPGAGRGLLASDVWAYALHDAPKWADALRYMLVERGPADSPLGTARRARLSAALTRLGAPEHATRWVSSVAEIGASDAYGCVVANELVDALPVHIVQAHGGVLSEVYVGVASGSSERLIERIGPLSRPELADYLDHFHIPWREYPDGWRAEICLEATTWMHEIAGIFASGFTLVIDYGDTARRLYTRDRRRGTLAAYREHQLVERPLAHPGRQDLTAHVNFSALIEAGRAAGLTLAGITSQRAFLEHLGIHAEAETRATQLYPFADSERHTDRGQTDHLRRSAFRTAVATLLQDGGLGGFRVLILHRGVPGARHRLAGLG